MKLIGFENELACLHRREWYKQTSRSRQRPRDGLIPP